MGTIKMVQPAELNEGVLRGSVILDVRTAMEHAEQRLKLPHVHIPVNELKPSEFLEHYSLNKNSPVVVICLAGPRSQKAAEMLCHEGMMNVYVVEGGVRACGNQGLEMEGHLVSQGASGQKTPISLERQVQITAGLITGTGVLLGMLIHPYFLMIPLFVSGGLIFAGTTNRCGLALLLTKAPWNRQPDPPVPSGQSCELKRPS